ncbi:MAG: beta-ketoadipate enol-lactone hydrolase (3-oxoadipate enol-lactonase)-like protein [Ramlibacter sp.]|nr:beta-ketoadipate enol-lactone hydrolase (3-oxoadipate enol-lactonase)-like protein [Ramlibacter sp.]MDB5913493.1 beta-ketoadipate enol-lactone hydrolase (3-oxoadipate enol-lactonase)-like protein [Ramlibacter sp.]
MTAVPTFTTLGGGPTVLMLHGIGGGHLAFAPQVETLAGAGYRAVAWDAPGYGHSAPIEPYTFKGLAQSCVRLIESLQCEKVVLVGHSMGGMVAQEVVARRPELVSRLVLSGTSPAFGKPDGDWQREFIASRTAPLDAGRSMAELAETLVPQLVGPGSLPEGVRLATHCMGLVPAATYRRALECIVTFDRRNMLDQIGVPTLVIAGEHDRNAPPAVMKKMAAAIPRSTYIEMKGIGHLQNLEAPEDFDGLLLNFLALPEALLH